MGAGAGSCRAHREEEPSGDRAIAEVGGRGLRAAGSEVSPGEKRGGGIIAGQATWGGTRMGVL